MRVFSAISEMRKWSRERKSIGDTIGLIPTMGYLHEGHLSLIKRAKSECDTVVLSIFVNPLQFGPNEDFERYPRDHERDLRLAREAGADAVFLPEVAEMYSQPMLTAVSVKKVTEPLCGAARPGHFAGVATVVLKLFNIVQPDRAFFGMKDAQQVAVIRQMVDDLNVPVTIVPCPILRQEDGLAMSSRNVFLSAEERNQALILSRTLNKAEDWMREPGITAKELEARMKREIGTQPLARIDYAQILAYPSLVPIEGDLTEAVRETEVIAALAVYFGKTRLIDNRIFRGEH